MDEVGSGHAECTTFPLETRPLVLCSYAYTIKRHVFKETKTVISMKCELKINVLWKEFGFPDSDEIVMFSQSLLPKKCFESR